MNIKKVIKAHGLTIEETAKRMGITRVTLSQNIAGNITIATLQRIAKAVGCSVADFFADEYADTHHNEHTITCPRCGAKLELELKE